MKNRYKFLIITLITGFLSSGCEDYLSVPPDATLTEDVVFSTYNNYQGFIDPCYDLVVDNNNNSFVGTANMGTEAANSGTGGTAPTQVGLNLDYWTLGDGGRSIWAGLNAGVVYPIRLHDSGLWDWWPAGCRIANLALAPENLNRLVDATPEQRDRLRGQAYFFRAYLNFEIARAYGTIPYLDQVYDQSNLKQPRHWSITIKDKDGIDKIYKDYHALSEKASMDLDSAAKLLPIAWDAPQLGRITKGAALALKAKVLLYAGSPLMVEAANNNMINTTAETPYDKDYLTRAAEAAAEVIDLGVYSLAPWGTDEKSADGYRKNFTTISGEIPYTSESIFQKWTGRETQTGEALFRFWFSRIFCKPPHGHSLGQLDVPLILYMDKFEMRDGSQYKPGNTINGGYDDDLVKFNTDRDPRFDYNFYLHNEVIGVAPPPAFENLGVGIIPANKGPFYITKFWYPGVDFINKGFGQFRYKTPSIRYADLLLMYAECVFEATGNPDASIGTTLTARQALNLVRSRALMPDYDPTVYSTPRASHGEFASDDPFRVALRNERAVELAYEGHYWFDLRRWKRSFNLEKSVYVLNFNKAYTSVNRQFLQSYPFEVKHYWLPFPIKTTQMYEGWEQNPGF